MYWILEKTEQETCCVKFVSIIREDFLWADRKTTDKRFIVLLNPQTAFDDEVSEERNAQRNSREHIGLYNHHQQQQTLG